MPIWNSCKKSRRKEWEKEKKHNSNQKKEGNSKPNIFTKQKYILVNLETKSRFLWRRFIIGRSYFIQNHKQKEWRKESGQNQQRSESKETLKKGKHRNGCWRILACWKENSPKLFDQSEEGQEWELKCVLVLRLWLSAPLDRSI